MAGVQFVKEKLRVWKICISAVHHIFAQHRSERSLFLHHRVPLGSIILTRQNF